MTTVVSQNKPKIKENCKDSTHWNLYPKDSAWFGRPNRCAWKWYMGHWYHPQAEYRVKQRWLQCGQFDTIFTYRQWNSEKKQACCLLTAGKLFIWLCLSFLICETEVTVLSLEMWWLNEITHIKNLAWSLIFDRCAIHIKVFLVKNLY